MNLKDLMDHDLRTVFFNPDEFATSALYTPKAGSPITINGLFERQYRAELRAENYVDTFVGLTADLATAVVNETIVIDGTTYYIAAPPEISTDGTTLVYLAKEPV